VRFDQRACSLQDFVLLHEVLRRVVERYFRQGVKLSLDQASGGLPEIVKDG
jgi:hypothetical protein